jgi:hypothetical protein
MDHICFDIICIMYFGSFGRILERFVNFLKLLEKSSRLFFDLFFALHFSTYWRYTICPTNTATNPNLS